MLKKVAISDWKLRHYKVMRSY